MAATIRGTLDELAAYQKTPVGAAAYSRWVNRRLGRILAAVTFHVGCTPSQVSIISAIFSAGGIAVIAAGPPAVWSGPLIALLLLVGYAFDSADGQLARLQGSSSAAGEWLDHTFDCAKIVSLHLAVVIGLYGRVDDGVLLVPMVFLVLDVTLYFSWLVKDQLERGLPAVSRPTHAPVLSSVLRLFEDYGFLCLLFLLWGSATNFAVAYSAVAAATSGFAILALPKRYVQLKSQSGATA